jgi:hypothetical protein
MQLSTPNTGLYYYDYVFIKKLRRRQKNNSARRQATFWFGKCDAENRSGVNAVARGRGG